MRKFQLLALMLVSSQACAEWELVGGDGKSSSYIDKSTIRKQGLYNAMWTMANFKVKQKIDEGEFWSIKYLSLYDCRDRTSGTKAIASYGEKMGAGNVVFSHSFKSFEVEFTDVLPDSVGEAMLNAACEK